DDGDTDREHAVPALARGEPAFLLDLRLHEGLDEKPDAAQLDRVAVFEARLADLALVDEDLVHRAEVAAVQAVGLVLEHGVMARDFAVRHADGAIRVAADLHRLRFHGDPLAGGGAGQHYEPVNHNGRGFPAPNPKCGYRAGMRQAYC